MGGSLVDLILTGGRIITLDGAGTITEAVAIASDRFIAIGSTKEISALAGPSCRRIDLGGRAVIPGLIDGHAHLDREGLKSALPSLAGARSVADILARIRELAQSAVPGAWIVTGPIGDPPEYQGVPANLREGRAPTRWELDEVSPHNPVYIRAPWGYWSNEAPLLSVANSLALAKAGIDCHTQPPSPLIEIARDPASGEPSGVFREATLMPIVEFTLMAAAPNFTAALRHKALADSMAIYNRFGTTSVFEGHGVAQEVISAYQEIRSTGRQTVRAHLTFSPGWSGIHPSDISCMIRSWAQWLRRRGSGDEWLRVAGLYTEIDEASEGRLRAQASPMTGWAGFSPDSGLPRSAVLELLQEAARNEIRVVGIWANLLDLFAEVDRAIPISGCRWVLGHQSTLSPDQIALIRDLGVVLTTHTNRHIYKEGAKLRDRLGSDGVDAIVPLRRLIDEGVPVAFGSDNLPPSLFHPIWHAVARMERSRKEIIAPAQRISRLESLRCATLGGAYLSFEEHDKGSIEVGKYADLAVLSDDPLTVDLAALPSITAMVTVVGGKIVHQMPPGESDRTANSDA